MRIECSHCKHWYRLVEIAHWKNKRVCLRCKRDLKALDHLKRLHAKPVSVKVDDIESDLLNNKES